MFLLVKVVFAVLLILPGAKSVKWGRFEDLKLKTSVVTQSKQTVTSTCSCKLECMVNPLCQAVSLIVTSSAGVLDCVFSNENISAAMALEEQTGVTTYVKDEWCYPPMRLVLGVDCLFFSTKTSSYTQAKTSACPHDSKLFAPPSLEVFYNLTNYLKEGSFASDYWLYVDRLSDKTWVWGAAQHTYGTDVLKTNVWGPNDPDNDEPCARLMSDFGYKLGDRICSSDFNFICVQI